MSLGCCAQGPNLTTNCGMLLVFTSDSNSSRQVWSASWSHRSLSPAPLFSSSASLARRFALNRSFRAFILSLRSSAKVSCEKGPNTVRICKARSKTQRVSPCRLQYSGGYADYVSPCTYSGVASELFKTSFRVGFSYCKSTSRRFTHHVETRLILPEMGDSGFVGITYKALQPTTQEDTVKTPRSTIQGPANQWKVKYSRSAKRAAEIGRHQRASLYLECLDGLHGLLAYALGFVLGHPFGLCWVLAILDGGPCLIAHLPLSNRLGLQGLFSGMAFIAQCAWLDQPGLFCRFLFVFGGSRSVP